MSECRSVLYARRCAGEVGSLAGGLQSHATAQCAPGSGAVILLSRLVGDDKDTPGITRIAGDPHVSYARRSQRRTGGLNRSRTGQFFRSCSAFIRGAGHIGVSELNRWLNSWGQKVVLGLQLGDGCNKKIKDITISQRTLLAFRYKLYGDFEKR